MEEEITNLFLINLFANAEIYHGILINDNENIIDDEYKLSILFKIIYKEDNFYFLLYDYNNLYYCKQNEEEVKLINSQLNHSLEYKDLPSLINFLIEVFIEKNKEIIFKISNDENEKFKIKIDSKLDNLTIKYEFNTNKINTENTIIAMQNLFIKPINNLLIALGNFINNKNNIIHDNNNNFASAICFEDILPVIQKDSIKFNKGFSHVLANLNRHSSKAINANYINKNEEENKSHVSDDKSGKNNQTKKQDNLKSKNIKNKGSKCRKFQKAKFINSDAEKSNDEDNKDKSIININEINIDEKKDDLLKKRKAKRKKMGFI